MADFSLQLQADNLPIDVVDQLLIEGPWKPIMNRMVTAENILLEGCRGVGKTMLMRAATQRLNVGYTTGNRVFGVHATFKRYLATLPPPSTTANNDAVDLSNFRAWINARILGAVKETILEIKGPAFIDKLGDLGAINWTTVVSVLETTYRGGSDMVSLLADIGINRHTVVMLQGYTYTLNLLKNAKAILDVDLLILFLDDAAHALDTRAQGAFFTTVKSLYDSGLAFKISVYPAVTRYGTDFSYGHDATVVALGSTPRKENVQSFRDLLTKRSQIADKDSKSLINSILSNSTWPELLYYCSNANPRALLKLVAQVQTQLGDKKVAEIRFQDIRSAITTVIDKHLDNMVPGVIKNIDPRLLKASEFLLDELRSKISDKPGPYESGKPRAYLAITNSMQVPYLCQAATRLLVAANVIIPEGPARLSKRETGTLYMLHPGFIFRDNVISTFNTGTLSASDWLQFFDGISSRVHAEISKSAELWVEITSEMNNEPTGNCENGHPIYSPRLPCETCGAAPINLSPVSILLDKNIDVLEVSQAIKDRLLDRGYLTVRQIFEATDAELDAVEYIGEVRITLIRSAVSTAVDEFIAG